MAQSVGRNEPCPCGSGRKFKHCCQGKGPGAGAGPESLYIEGLAHEARGDAARAADCYRAALARRPGFVEAHVNLGNALHLLGRHAEALENFRRALALRPRFVEVQLNIGASLQALRRCEEAVACYRAALPACSADARVHNNLALALRDCGRLEQAIASFRDAAQLEPDDADIRDGYCDALRAAARYADVVDVRRDAAAASPADARRHSDLAAALLDAGRVDEAIAGFRRALDLEPQLADAYSQLLMALLYSDRTDPRELRRAHREYGARFADPLEPALAHHDNVPDPDRRLKIGYVSGDLRTHSVAYFIGPVIDAHDRGSVEVHCYHVGAKEDETTLGLRASADRWHHCADVSDEALAQRIRDDGIDVLVDLSGHTGGHRLLAFARRPAPIQVSWIGYPGESGLRQIACYLSDAPASPGETEDGGTASAPARGIMRLGTVFSCYRPPAAAPDVAAREAVQTDGLVLGSFNNIAKISDRTVQVWSAALRAVPGARLALKDRRLEDPSVRAWIQGRFAAQGILAQRVMLLPRTPADFDHLAQYGAIDVALDTYPYCGATTTCEALWMGVPVVSLAGDTCASRMGLSLLSAAGYPQWVATSERDFVDRVVGLAGDAAGRARLRQELRDRLRSSALLDGQTVTREAERAFRRLWHAWCGEVGAPGTHTPAHSPSTGAAREQGAEFAGRQPA